MPEGIAIDFETFYSKKLKYTLKIDIAETYCKSPLFDVYMISVCDGRSTWVGSPKDFNWAALNDKMVGSHNNYYDRTVFYEMQNRGWVGKDIKPREWFCTANLSSYMCGFRALDDAMELLFGEKISKQVRSDADNKHWPADFTPEQQAAMREYARADAFNCWRIFDKYYDSWPVLERRLSEITISQGMRGVAIDRALLETQIMQSHEMKLNAEKLIPWITEASEEWEGFEDNKGKPASTKCIAEQCRRAGIPCCPVKSDDEEAYAQWELTYAPRHPWIKALSAWRSVNKIYKTFLLVKDRLRADGTMPFGTKYFGAHTGRWSGDARINFQNFRKKPILCNETGLYEDNEKRINGAIETHEGTGKWPEWVRYAIDFRHLILPRPGKKMIASDLRQIEPRVLAWLSGDTSMLDMLRTGMSVYEAHARNTMEWTGGNLQKENPDIYKLAKARVLALGYGAAWEKFITMAMEQARIDITLNDPEWVEETNPFTGEVKQVSGYGSYSKQTVREFREQNPKTTGLWSKLDTAFKQSIGSDFVMTLPSGRKMTYRGVKRSVRIEQDEHTGKPWRKTVFTAQVGHRRVSCYGGLLTENIVQAVARDVFAEHIVRLEDTAGIINLWGNHDEAVLEVDNDVRVCDVETLMSYCPEWLNGCPIAAAAKEIPHYLK
jgi:hypothetical protein